MDGMRKIWLIIAAASAVALAFGGYSGQSPEDARRAVREIALRADSGEPEAIYQLGSIYERGFDSIPKDSLKAIELYRLAADGGSLKAQNYLGYYLIKNGSGKDAAEGLGWLEKAAMAGDSKAQSNIGFLLLGGNGVEQDYEKAAYWLERAAAGGVPAASSMLGDLYKDGLGVARDSLQAEAHYYAALDAGLADAAYKLEAMLAEKWSGMKPEEQLQTALHFYTHRAPDVAIPILMRLALEDGYDSPSTSDTRNSDVRGDVRAKAEALLGDAYTRALGVGYDYNKSTRYYLMAALDGNPSAAFVISELLEIFPDAINDILQERSIGDPAGDPDRLNDPYYWREKAAQGGVLSAEEAMRALFADV